VHFRERRYGSFQRGIALPTAIDAGAAEAEFADGLLTVTLPKTEETKPRRIDVKVRS
jgi:HSP20 family molecular chaperone IbpA